MDSSLTSSSTISCHCGAFSLPVTYLKVKNYPIESPLCHCNPCRQTTGTILGATFIDLNEAPPSSLIENTLTAYPSSSKSTRYFCSSCGGGVLMRDIDTDRWFMGTGSINRPDLSPDQTSGPDTVRVTLHEWIDDAKDGGAVYWQRELGGRKIPCFAEDYQNNEQPLSEHDLDHLFIRVSTSTTPREETLSVRCHCGTISFVLTPPDPAREYNDTALRFLHTDRTKFVGKFCACQSDRLSCAMQMMSWVYPPVEHVLNAEGGKQLDTKKIEGLKRYQPKASEGATRSFCGTCGACVFYENSDRPEVLNVAAGLLRAQSGVLARDWVEWHKDISWVHESRDAELVAAMTA